MLSSTKDRCKFTEGLPGAAVPVGLGLRKAAPQSLLRDRASCEHQQLCVRGPAPRTLDVPPEGANDAVLYRFPDVRRCSKGPVRAHFMRSDRDSRRRHAASPRNDRAAAPPGRDLFLATCDRL